MRYKRWLRLPCALASAALFIWAMHALSQPGAEDFLPHGWSDHGPITPDNPLVVDTDKRAVRVYARVNGKYFYLPTRHGMNYRGGSIGNKALFRAWANPIDVDRALLSLGAEPGQNLDSSTGGETVQGADLAVSVNWKDAPRAYPIDDLVIDSSGKGVAYRFGGNIELSKKARTGCMMCMDSCPVGITSNMRHPQGSFHRRKLSFRGRADRLPPDGTPVVVTLALEAS